MVFAHPPTHSLMKSINQSTQSQTTQKLIPTLYTTLRSALYAQERTLCSGAHSTLSALYFNTLRSALYAQCTRRLPTHCIALKFSTERWRTVTQLNFKSFGRWNASNVPISIHYDVSQSLRLRSTTTASVQSLTEQSLIHFNSVCQQPFTLPSSFIVMKLPSVTPLRRLSYIGALLLSLLLSKMSTVSVSTEQW